MLKRLTELSPHSVPGFLLRLPLRLLPHGQVVWVLGGVNQGARWIASSSTHGCWVGTYEHATQSLVAARIKAGMTVWDIGANAGFYTLAFSRLTGRYGHVYAFEPLAENAWHLLRHIRLNHLENCTVIQAALSDRTSLSGFAVAESNSMGHLTSQATSYQVPTLSADAYLTQFPQARPQFIKVDIEGGEADFLRGAYTLLREHGPELLISLHSEEQARDCREILHSVGYKLFRPNGERLLPQQLLDGEVSARRH